jgi:hypothetical protein
MLKAAACDLHLKQWDEMRMTGSDVCVGIVRTDWKSYTIGSRSGVLFKATLTEESGDYQVNFLLSHKDLERGAEIFAEMEENPGEWESHEGRIPLEELYRFEDLSRSRSKYLN